MGFFVVLTRRKALSGGHPVSDMNMVVDAPVNAGEATVKETPVDQAGTESVASEPSKEGLDRAGAPQGDTEGGSASENMSRPRGPTKLDTIRELRAKLRERDQRYGSEMEALRGQVEELKSMMASGPQSQKQSKTFWEAPEEVLDERIGRHLNEMEKRMLNQINQRQQIDQETSEWKQETSEAAEFIRSQKNLTDDDIEDIKDYVRENPVMEKLRPMERAQYALYLWREQRGIGDKSAIKARAQGVVGSPAPAGRRTWTEEEVNRELAKFPSDPKHWTPEQNKAFEALDREIRQARSDGRMK